MTRVSDAATRLDQSFFVGRERELAIFRDWLDRSEEAREILAVTGPGGVGKTTLLHAFEQTARELGPPAALIDGHDFPATPAGLLSALGGSAGNDIDVVAGKLNSAPAVVLLDGFDALIGLTGYLQQELLPRLDTRVKWVIASRQAPSSLWISMRPWLTIRSLALPGFSFRESLEYLARRGIDDADFASKVASVAGGNPLALSLAADMVLQFGVHDFAAKPEWHLVVRSLSERLLHGISDAALRELLEACAIVHQFDEPTLAAVSGRDDVSAAFGQLCNLSMVKPSQHGLQLHDDVRRYLAADLSWRHPQRYNLFRARALAYYRDRLRDARPSDYEWLVAECFFLWSNAVIQQVFFSPAEPATVAVGPRRPGDDEHLHRLYADRLGTTFGEELGEPLPEPPWDRDVLDAILRYPPSRIRVARDDCSRAIGFTTVIPVSKDSLPILRLHPGTAALLDAWGQGGRLAGLPAAADSSRLFNLGHVVYDQSQAGAVRSALLRDLSGLFALQGTYFCSTVLPSYKRLLEACGFERVPGAQGAMQGTSHLFDGYVLDLSAIGFDAWIEAMVNGRPLHRPPAPALLEAPLQEALQHWDDDRWLDSCRLTAMLPACNGSPGNHSATVRKLISSALAVQLTDAAPDLKPAYRAVELAYCSHRRNHKQAIRTMAVSRATFYRLLKRGIQGLSVALSRALAETDLRRS